MDTGFASARVKIRDASPRSGLPPTFHGWEEFENYTDALVAMGNIPDFSWFWWDVRPHPLHGTVELRVPDAQAQPEYVIALAALTQCLVATAQAYTPEDARFVSENKWRAIRRGLDARFYDFDTGEEKGAREIARDLVARLRPVSQDLGCEAELEGVSEILRRGTGADLQRAVYEKRGSLEDVVEYLLETSAPFYRARIHTGTACSAYLFRARRRAMARNAAAAIAAPKKLLAYGSGTGGGSHSIPPSPARGGPAM